MVTQIHMDRLAQSGQSAGCATEGQPAERSPQAVVPTALLRELKGSVIEQMRRHEPDYDEEIDLATQEILVGCVDAFFENRIFDIEATNTVSPMDGDS